MQVPTVREMKLELPSHFSEESLFMLKKQPRMFQAHACDARTRQIEAQNKRNFLEIGLVGLFVEENELWKELIGEDGQLYRSWDAWVMDAAPISRAYAYDAKSKIKILRENKIPLEEAAKIPQCNLKQLVKLSTPVMRDPEILKKAATLSENAFYEEVRTSHPNEHLCVRSPMKFAMEISERKIIDAAIDMARLLDEAVTREEAILAICTSYLDQHREQWEATQPRAMAATV